MSLSVAVVSRRGKFDEDIVGDTPVKVKLTREPVIQEAGLKADVRLRGNFPPQVGIARDAITGRGNGGGIHAEYGHHVGPYPGIAVVIADLFISNLAPARPQLQAGDEISTIHEGLFGDVPSCCHGGEV